MPCLVSLTGKDDDFQSLSWATWATFTTYHPCLKADRVTSGRWSAKPVLAGSSLAATSIFESGETLFIEVLAGGTSLTVSASL
jgi:hypothetical protein